MTKIIDLQKAVRKITEVPTILNRHPVIIAGEALDNWVEQICDDLEASLEVRTTMNSKQDTYICAIAVNEYHPQANKVLVITIPVDEIIDIHLWKTTVRSVSKFHFGIGMDVKDALNNQVPAAMNLEDADLIINTFYEKCIKPMMYDGDKLIFDADLFADRSIEEFVNMIYEVYQAESEVCMGEFLGQITIQHASVNEVTYIFARLHELADEDESYIIIEGDTQRLADYL